MRHLRHASTFPPTRLDDFGITTRTLPWIKNLQEWRAEDSGWAFYRTLKEIHNLEEQAL